MQKFYYRKKTIKAKEEIGKYGPISQVWQKNFAPSDKIGNVTNLFQQIRPKNEEDFCTKYFQYAEEHKNLPISKRGLTYKEFVEMVNKYKSMADAASGMEIPYDTYFNDALCHVITETYDGKIAELDFIKILEKLGYKCDWFEGSIDAKYGVDIKITRESDNKVSAIQIKPIKFFRSRRNDVCEDRVKLVQKYYNFLKDYNCKTYYAIYRKDPKNGCLSWQKNGDGFRFKLNELFEYDENNIANTLKTKHIYDNFCCRELD